MSKTVGIRPVSWLAAVIAVLLALAGVLAGAPQSAYASPYTWEDPDTGVRYLIDPANPSAGATIWGAFTAAQRGGGNCAIFKVADGSDTTVTFRSTITVDSVDYTVVGIEPHAFDWVPPDCGGTHVSFGYDTVVIPPTVTWIGEGAFSEAQVGRVEFDPAGQLTTIGADAFFGIIQTDFTIPASVTSIGAQAFFVQLNQTFTFLGDPPTVAAGTDYTNTFTRFTPDTHPTLYFDCDAAGVTFPTWNGYHTAPSPGQVCYDPNGGGGSLVRQAGSGNVTLLPPGLTRDHYSLSGWNTAADGSGTEYLAGASADVGTTALYLYAQWTGETITYTFVGNGATGGSTASISGEYGTDFTLPANGFTWTAFDFAGWGLTSSASTLYQPGSTRTFLSDTTMYARWAAHAYSITTDLAGGSVATPNPTTYTYETFPFTLVNPTRTGYDFAGWTGTGLSEPTMVVEFPAGSYGDRSYTATWTLVGYSIDYDLAGGTQGSPTNPVGYTVESGAIVLSQPTRTGYDFVGWTGTGLSGPTATVAIPAGATGDRSYTATWSPTDYAISYDLAGGTEGAPANPTGYTVESDEIVLSNPSLAGHTFLGWQGTDLSAPALDVHIPAGSTGDRSYTAVWAEVVVTLDSAAAAPGDAVGVHVDGLLPGGSYSIVMHSSPVVLATLVAAGDGTIDATVHIPGSAPVGPHTIAVAPSDDDAATITLAALWVLQLASTGVEPGLMLALAAALLALGLGLFGVRRRRRA
jgi:uncharacterized repeat protein (TIGR02543 family)/LPXTG-motif cell wall-anchored protein